MKKHEIPHVSARLLMALVLWGGGAGTASAQSYIEQAKAHIESKQYEQAIKVLQASRAEAQSKNGVAVVDNLIGWSYFSAGKVSDAESSLASALASAERENNAEVRRLAANNLGVVYFVQGDLDRSLSFFNEPYTRETRLAQQYRKLIARKRVEIDAEHNIQEGIAARRGGKFDDAVLSYEKALRLTPDDARILEFKGYALYRMDKYDEAARTLESGIMFDTERTRPFLALNLVKTYCAAGKDEQISSLLRAASVSSVMLQSWWDKDAELRAVCASSIALREASGRQ